MAAKQQVIGVGEILWDLLPGGKQLGGAPGNFAYHTRQQGCAGIIISAVGEDDNGRELLQTLGERGVPTDHVVVLPGRPTGTVHVELDEKGKATYDIVQGVAWDFIPLTPAVEHAARAAAAICFGTLAQRHAESRRTIMRLLEIVPPTCLRVFDVNLRQHFYAAEVIEASLRLTDLFKLSDEELSEIAGLLNLPADEPAFCREVMNRYGVRMVAVTAGGDGSRLHTRDRISRQAPAKVEIEDTVGAGDSFTAGLISGLLRGDDLDTAHAHAARLAGYVCTQRGAMPKIPDHLIAGC